MIAGLSLAIAGIFSSYALQQSNQSTNQPVSEVSDTLARISNFGAFLNTENCLALAHATSLPSERRHFSAAGNHGHYDCRFYSPETGHKERRSNLKRLYVAWYSFCRFHKCEFWLAHGTLLGWFWGKQIQPWDDDIDINIGFQYLLAMAPLAGTVWGGRYLFEMNPNRLNRHEQMINVIDAEFIDMMSGAKIDIVGVAQVHATAESAARCGLPLSPDLVVGGRDSKTHATEWRRLFPLQDTSFEGHPAKVPADARFLLEREYGASALDATNFNGYAYDENKGKWVQVNIPASVSACDALEVKDAAFTLPDSFQDVFVPFDVRADAARRTKTASAWNRALESTLTHVDVDNGVAEMPAVTRSLRITEYNILRGSGLCKQALEIRDHPKLKETDIFFVNEADVGMARSGNKHTARQLAYRLGLNYAWGLEFIELSHGTETEIQNAEEATSCPKEWRGETFSGHWDSMSFHGNALFSKWPLEDVRVIRLPGIEHLYDPQSSQDLQITANGKEQRLGGRMVLYATIRVGNTPIHLGCFHMQMLWDRGPELESLGKPSIELLRAEHNRRDPTGTDRFILAGDGWKDPWFTELGLSAEHSYMSGDWVSSKGFTRKDDLVIVRSSESDHPALTVQLDF